MLWLTCPMPDVYVGGYTTYDYDAFMPLIFYELILEEV